MGDYTEFIQLKMDEWTEVIYDIEDRLVKLEDNIPALMEYLKDLRYSMPLGLALRRYFCEHLGRPAAGGVELTFPDGSSHVVKDLRSDGYDIQKDDLKTYADLFLAILQQKNGTLLDKQFSRTEVNRLLRHTTTCTRSKLFLLSFALGMDAESVHWFLTSVLMEQTYNMRKPEEVIAFFCQTNEAFRSYASYCRLCGRYENEIQSVWTPEAGSTTPGFTRLAHMQMEFLVRTEEELMDFLRKNQPNFAGYSRTAYAEYVQLVEKAMACSEIQLLSSDEYLTSETAATTAQRARQKELIDRSLEIRPAENTEQLAKAMLACIPRATREYERGGKKIVESDFIPIYNGESRQKSSKVQTTVLPKEITMNLLMKDRLDDLLAQRKPVERKDLVFLKFYVFCMGLQKKGSYSSSDYSDFISECNSMLSCCGMADLCPANRFENLLLLSLVSSNPFEMFENIIDASFIHEPGSAAEES